MAEQGGEKEVAIGVGVVGGAFILWHYLSGFYHGIIDDGVPNKDPQEQVGAPLEDLAGLPICSQLGELHLMEPGDHDPQAPEFISLELGYEEPVPIWAGEISCPYGTEEGPVAVNGVKRCLAVSPLGGAGVGSNHFSAGCTEP